MDLICHDARDKAHEPTQYTQLHLVIQGLEQYGADDHNPAEIAPNRTHEARQLVVVDTHSGSVTVLHNNEDDFWQDGLAMNVHHTFECPAGAFLLIGLGQLTRKDLQDWPECRQQLLLYRAGGMPHAGEYNYTNSSLFFGIIILIIIIT